MKRERLHNGNNSNYCCLVAKLGLTLCDPMDCSMPGFPVLHHLLEFAQTHVHGVDDDAFQPFRTMWTFSPFSMRVTLKTPTVGGWKPQGFGSQTGGSKSSLNTFWPKPPSRVEILLKYCTLNKSLKYYIYYRCILYIVIKIL